MHLLPTTPARQPRVTASRARLLTTCNLIRLCPRELTHTPPRLNQRTTHNLRSDTRRIVAPAGQSLMTLKCELLMVL